MCLDYLDAFPQCFPLGYPVPVFAWTVCDSTSGSLGPDPPCLSSVSSLDYGSVSSWDYGFTGARGLRDRTEFLRAAVLWCSFSRLPRVSSEGSIDFAHSFQVAGALESHAVDVVLVSSCTHFLVWGLFIIFSHINFL